MNDKDFITNDGVITNDEHFLRAKRRVKAIKGFYTHLMIYLFMNLIISTINMFFNHDIHDSKTFFMALTHFSTYMTWIIWGIGLLAHGINVFWLTSSRYSKWEERKIQEIMKQEAEDQSTQYN